MVQVFWIARQDYQDYNYNNCENNIQKAKKAVLYTFSTIIVLQISISVVSISLKSIVYISYISCIYLFNTINFYRISRIRIRISVWVSVGTFHTMRFLQMYNGLVEYLERLRRLGFLLSSIFIRDVSVYASISSCLSRITLLSSIYLTILQQLILTSLSDANPSLFNTSMK